jgi:hypothetical protein
MSWYKTAKKSQPLKKVRLGRTSLYPTILGLGGANVLAREKASKKALEVLNRAQELGINYLDSARDYGNGSSLKTIGKFLKGQNRKDFIVTTKVSARSYRGAKDDIKESLDFLGTDYIDIVQVHSVGDVEDWNKCKDATLRAIVEAHEDGLAKHVGVTGHANPKGLMKALKDYKFDTILMALNAADVHYKSFQKKLLPFAVDQGIGVIAMKILGYGHIFNPDGITTVQEAVDYVYSLPVDIGIIGVDNVKQLEENVEAVKNFKKISAAKKAAFEDMTKFYHKDALFFREGYEEQNVYW